MMKRRLMAATLCALALTANGTGALFAQTRQRTQQVPPPPPQRDIVIERHGGMPGMPLPPPPHEGEFFSMQIAPGAPPPPGEAFSFSFMSSDMHFDSKIVKGAPYSAESVTESVQVLADGNRITRTSKASLYRDGDGRTRRDQTLNHIGPWATSDEPAQSIFINDPIAGAHYILNPRTRTAQKISNALALTRAPRESGVQLRGDATRERFFVRKGEDSLVMSHEGTQKTPGGGGLAGKAVKRVPPTYPPVAKAAGAEGPVSVQIVVNEAGAVETARATSGHPLLQPAAVAAAKEWQFTPTKLSGNNVKVSGTISFVFTLPKEDAASGAVTFMRPPAPGHAPEGERVKPVKESLGKQMIEGVEAEGTRTTITFPAGIMGNERPINIVSERWYSPELQTVVLSKHSDPRFGETNYRLTNINRGEPARTLFEVPSDYTVKEGQPIRRMLQRTRTPEQK